MVGQKVDRRVRRTKKMLLEGLTQLMAQKKINKITVKELTELVDVNRATFYLYYKDIFDMLEQIEMEMLENLNHALVKFCNEDATYDNLLNFLTYAFEFIQDNANICKILLGPDGDYGFVEKMKEIIKTASATMGQNFPDVKRRYSTPFIISGCIGVLQQWLGEDMLSTPQEMAIFLIDMIVNGEKFLTQPTQN
jgi:AcrR family transcriptional regulator